MYIAYDLIDFDVTICKTEEEAREFCEGRLKWQADYAEREGWPSDMEGAIGYGKIICSIHKKLIADRKHYTDEEWADEGYSDEWDEIVDYELTKTKEIDKI